MKHFRLSHLIIIALTALTACTANDIEELVATPTEGAYTYNLHLNMPNPDADATATRAAGVWADGSRVDFYFYTSVGTRVYTGIPGTATYSAKDDSWTLTTTQPLPSGPTNTDCEARYVKPGSDPTNEYFNAVYFATSTYTLHDNDVYTDLTLKPCNGRLRFRGTAGTQFTLTATNLRHCAGDSLHAISYSAPAGFITKTTIPLTVGSDGYTAYIYGVFTNTSTLTMSTGGNQYTRTITPTVLSSGKSIALEVPQKNDTKGWEIVIAPFTTAAATALYFDATPASSWTIAVSSNENWTATSSATSWCTITPTSGSGNGNVSVTVTKNESTNPRSANITIKGSTSSDETVVSVTQEGKQQTGNAIRVLTADDVYPDPVDGTFDLVVRMDFDTNETLVGFNFNLTLPEGVDFNTTKTTADARKKCCDFGELIDEDVAFEGLTIYERSSGGYLFNWFWDNSTPLLGTKGTLMTIKLKADPATLSGTGKIFGIGLSNNKSQGFATFGGGATIADVEFGINNGTLSKHPFSRICNPTESNISICNAKRRRSDQ